ncbi:unnamed protein product [Cuscuta campestris]|uniref:Uncharacterized protein n=1 Tax=Cuscuta campestris TaxID=132261 RepID=A0A484NMG6_9ASTE|nr:unnamed protein product [Cuscuta campestris]
MFSSDTFKQRYIQNSIGSWGFVARSLNLTKGESAPTICLSLPAFPRVASLAISEHFLDRRLIDYPKVYEDGNLNWYDIEHGIMVLKDPFSSEKVVESRFINWPCGRTREDIHHVAATGGYIHYLLLASKEALQLWRLSDYARGDWTLVHKLHLNDNGLSRVVNSTHFIYLHPFKPEVAICVTARRIFLVNIEEKKILEQGQYSMSSLMLEDPLVIPWWPTSFLSELY